MKNLIIILITLLCINIKGQKYTKFHLPYFVTKIKYCTWEVPHSTTNDKQFYWDVTTMGSNPSEIVKEKYSFIPIKELDSEVIKEIKLYDSTEINIERYIGYKEDLYILYINCSEERNGFIHADYISFRYYFIRNKLLKNDLVGWRQHLQRNYRHMFCTKEGDKYITYLLVPYGDKVFETYKGRS